MTASNSEYLDLRNVQNYIRYMIGIGIESAAVGLLILLGFCVAALGIWFF
ncbi:MAG TPA: hypothetical protein VMD08_11290 [Candidatus Baltobacteraceae bacterium]|nr:hypothetical protein [Candidatus Baltobacteraceae bacterium]